MERMNFQSRWVLITGASSGLGREMARVLAREHGANVILVARREDRLRELKAELEATGVAADYIAADLSIGADVDRVFDESTRAGRSLYGVVLNAGITHFGGYDELSWSQFEVMLATNVSSVVRLATRYLPYLDAQGTGGGIMLVSSLAGLTPVPYQTAYSATKAFIVNFGCGLWHETRGRNVSVTTFVPGGIQTEMVEGERFRALGGWLMPVDKCARSALEAFAARGYMHVPGFTYRVGAALIRLLPQRFFTSRMAAVYRAALESSRRGESAGAVR
jgi:short-subunit dehydrogenase